MSKTDPPAGEYTLRVDERGVLVVVRATATVELFETIIADLVSHEGFRPEMGAVWDIRESSGFGTMSRDELARMISVSVRARHESSAYRVALVAGRKVDFGVGRMMEAGVARPERMKIGIFNDLEEAEAWAYGPPAW